MSATDELMRNAEQTLASHGGTAARDPSPAETGMPDPKASADTGGEPATSGDPAADATGRS